MPDQACNIACRRAYARVLRDLLTGRCTNWQYEDRRDAVIADLGSDDACEDIHGVVWTLYSDLDERSLRKDRRRSRELRRFGARCLLFLHSGERYASDCAPLLILPLPVVVYLLFWAAFTVSICVAPAFVIAAIGAAWAVSYLAIWAVGGVALRPGLLAHLDRSEGFDHWPFGDADRLRAAAAQPFWLTG